MMSVETKKTDSPEMAVSPLLLDVNPLPASQKWKPDMPEERNFEVGMHPVEGVGKALYAKQFIAKGSYILTFCGPLVNDEEATKRDMENFGRIMGNEMQIGEDFYIYLQEPGRLINHSCEPNAGIKNDTILTAVKDIQKGEEICFDYSSTMDEGEIWAMECLCGESNCRGFAADFRTLPAETRAKYLQTGIVQKFITKQYDPQSGELLCQPAQES